MERRQIKALAKVLSFGSTLRSKLVVDVEVWDGRGLGGSIYIFDERNGMLTVAMLVDAYSVKVMKAHNGTIK